MSGSDGPTTQADVLEIRRLLRKVIAREGGTPEGVAFLRGLRVLMLEEFGNEDTAGSHGDALEWRQTPMGIVVTRYSISKMPGSRGLWLRTRFRLACLFLGELGRPRMHLRDVRERAW
jgi:hypothetical protein